MMIWGWCGVGGWLLVASAVVFGCDRHHGDSPCRVVGGVSWCGLGQGAHPRGRAFVCVSDCYPSRSGLGAGFREGTFV